MQTATKASPADVTVLSLLRTFACILNVEITASEFRLHSGSIATAISAAAGNIMQSPSQHSPCPLPDWEVYRFVHSSISVAAVSCACGQAKFELATDYRITISLIAKQDNPLWVYNTCFLSDQAKVKRAYQIRTFAYCIDFVLWILWILHWILTLKKHLVFQIFQCTFWGCTVTNL